MNITLPTDSAERKNYPILSGCLKYFPAALAGVANVSKRGNDKHNPGQDLHHARAKSMDHGDCVLRHLMDTEDLLISFERNENTATPEQILLEADQMAWRALAYTQMLHEKFGSPMAPGAKNQTEEKTNNVVQLEKPKIKFKFATGDQIKHIANDGPQVTVAGNYYDADFKHHLFVNDGNGKIYSVDETFYKHAPIEVGAGG